MTKNDIRRFSLRVTFIDDHGDVVTVDVEPQMETRVTTHISVGRNVSDCAALEREVAADLRRLADQLDQVRGQRVEISRSIP